MSILKRLYFDLFVLAYALYAYFNKGIAYTYFSELLLAGGLMLILANIRQYAIAWDKRMLLLSFFIVLTAGYMVRGVLHYPIVDVIRDSVMFNYIFFVFIIYYLRDELPHLLKRLFLIYRWYPPVMCVLFLSASYIPSFSEISLFGGIPLFLYKFGDMGVHLFIATILLFNGYIRLSRRMLILQFMLIAYLFLIASSYSRSGMVSFVLSIGVFFLYSRDKLLRTQMLEYLKLVPILIVMALPLYLSTNLEENFQGRSLSLDQLKQNVTSIVSSSDDGSSLSDNKVWRLVWWAKIIDYTFMGEYFWQGKGLGMSLAIDDDISHDPTEGNLRSPHSFHLTVLARFGVPVFFLWLYWMFLHLKRIRKKDLPPFQLMVITISMAFLINASFDVFLEGPMGAFPFWTFVGIGYAAEMLQQQNKDWLRTISPTLDIPASPVV